MTVENRLTQEEAEQLAELLPKLQEEMDDMIREHGLHPPEVDYVTLIRRRYLEYLEEVYNVE